MIELRQKLQGVLDIAEGAVPAGLLMRALERMEEGHYRAVAKAAHSTGDQDGRGPREPQHCDQDGRGPMWEDVRHLEAAEEEAADWVNYVSGMVLMGELTTEEGRGVVEEIGVAWGMMRGFAAGEKGRGVVGGAECEASGLEGGERGLCKF